MVQFTLFLDYKRDETVKRYARKWELSKHDSLLKMIDSFEDEETEEETEEEELDEEEEEMYESGDPDEGEVDKGDPDEVDSNKISLTKPNLKYSSKITDKIVKGVE